MRTQQNPPAYEAPERGATLAEQVYQQLTAAVLSGTFAPLERINIRRLAEEGRSVIVISSEMPEVIGLSDRVLVMREGRVAGIVEGDALTEETIVRLAMGVKEAA